MLGVTNHCDAPMALDRNLANLARNRTSVLDGRRLLESAWRSCPHCLMRSSRVDVSPPPVYKPHAPAPMTNHRAGADVAGPVAKLCPGRRYSPAVVPALGQDVFVLCARDSLHSRVPGRASLDHQFHRHEDLWTLVPTERSLHWSPSLLRIRPKNLSQRGECPVGHTAIPLRQFPSRTCTTTSGSCSRAGVAVPKRDSQATLSGGEGAPVLPRAVAALKETSLHSGLQVAPSLEVRPQVHRSSLYLYVQADCSTGGDTSLGMIINSLSNSRALAVSLPEIRSAS